MKATKKWPALVLLLATILSACSSFMEAKHELTGLARVDGVQGHFFLASGYVGEDQKWVYSIKGEDKVSAVLSIDIEEGAYVEDIRPGETPYVEIFRCGEKWWNINFSNCEETLPEVLRPYGVMIGRLHIFHIPPNSVATLEELGFTTQGGE